MKYFFALILFFGFPLWAQTEAETKVTTTPQKSPKAVIVLEINLLGLNWEDLGILDRTKFPTAILSAWEKWFSENKSSLAYEFVACEGTCLIEFSRWHQFSVDDSVKASLDLPRDVWISISYNLRKKNYVPEIKEWQFEWSGRVVVLDKGSKKVLSTYMLEEVGKTWLGLEQKSLNSALATALYRAPLGTFQEFIKDAPQLVKPTRSNRLIISGHQNLEDVLRLMELLRKEVAPMPLEVKLELFGQKEAQFLCFYQAEEKSFTDLLSRLKELKSSKRFKIETENNGVLPVLKLIAE